MNKENSLYAIIGLLAGLIIGYAGTSYINGDAPSSRTNTAANAGALPPDHPSTPATPGDSGNSGSDSASNAGGGAQGEVMAVIGQARNEPSNFDAQMKAAASGASEGSEEGRGGADCNRRCRSGLGPDV